MDYSCYVTIRNDTTQELERTGETVDNGYYVSHPPPRIAPGTTGRFWLQDLAGNHGAEGGTTYATLRR